MPPPSPAGADCSGADQVGGDHVQAEQRTDSLAAAQPAPLDDPAEHRLDSTASVAQLGLALVASCGQVDDGTTVATGVLHHAHRAVDPPSCRIQPCGVVVLGEYGEASDRGIRVQLNNPAGCS